MSEPSCFSALSSFISSQEMHEEMILEDSMAGKCTTDLIESSSQ